MLSTSCRNAALLTATFAFLCFFNPRKINKLQTKQDSIPIVVKLGSAGTPHLPQPQRHFHPLTSGKSSKQCLKARTMWRYFRALQRQRQTTPCVRQSERKKDRHSK